MSVLRAGLSPTGRGRADEFAAMLEGTRPAEGHQLEPLVTLAATLRPVPLFGELTRPRADFRAALRERLRAEAAAQRPRAVMPAQRTPPDQPLREPSDQPSRHRVRRFVAAVVTAGLLAGAGAAAASTHALPGDPLYGLKRGLESVQLRLAGSDLSRGRELLEQAGARLSEAEALAADADSRSSASTRRIARALTEMDAATRSGAQALNTSYAETGDREPLVVLDRFAVDQRQRLTDLDELVDPAVRPRPAVLADLLAALRTRLGALLSQAGSSASADPASSGPEVGDTGVIGVARRSGDGWAVSRVVDRFGTGGGVRFAAAGAGVGTATTGVGPGVTSGVDAADAAVSGLTGAGTAASSSPRGGVGPAATSGSGAASSVLGAGGGTATASSAPVVPLPVPSLPVPAPAVSVPVVQQSPLPPVPTPVPTPAPTGEVSAPAPPSILPSSVPTPPCLPTPITPC